MSADPYAESAFSRARRDFPEAFTGTITAWAWNLLVVAGCGAGATYLAWGRRRSAQVLIGLASVIVAATVAASLAFAVVWLRSLARQRDEARAQIGARGAAIPTPATQIFIGGTHYHPRDGDDDD